MATVQIAFVKAMDGIAPITSAIPSQSETFTSSATSQATIITAKQGESLEVTSDGAVWVAIAETPTAVAGTHRLILAGQTRNFSISAGHKVAVIDA